MENISLNCALASVHYNTIYLKQLIFSKSLKYENEIFKLRRIFVNIDGAVIHLR